MPASFHKEIENALYLEYGETVSLEQVMHLFGMRMARARRAANTGELPVPAFRLGSTKSPWMVATRDLAKHMADRREEGLAIRDHV